MRYLIAILTIAALVCVAGSANAFTGCEYWGYTDIGSATNPYMLYAIPDEYVPTIDGDLSDVGWMPDGVMSFTRDTAPRAFGVVGGELADIADVPRDNFDVVVYGPAWVPATNSLYFGVHKVDDILYCPGEALGDCWKEDNQQWCTDPSGAGGNFRQGQNCNTAQQNFYTPKQGGHVGHFGPEEYNWRFEAPYGFFAQNLDEATGSYDMELMYNLWDWLDASPDESEPHTFEPGQLIGLTFYVRDRDDEDGNGAGIAWHCEDIWTDASLFTAFSVRPVEETLEFLATEPSTWGGIKAMFK
ncbi:MAG TPA: hypothetical protein ENF86_02530 [Firmicutes bacterium]|nr:hypothetical protein [Bacillota bacterium]